VPHELTEGENVLSSMFVPFQFRRALAEGVGRGEGVMGGICRFGLGDRERFDVFAVACIVLAHR
jgi:hypothetical protein